MITARTPKEWKDILKPLANETRMAILMSLRESEKNLGELARELSLPAYTVSHQLRHLQKANIVDLRQNGRFHYFRIRPSLIRENGSGKILDLGCCSFHFPPSQPGELTQDAQ